MHALRHLLKRLGRLIGLTPQVEVYCCSTRGPGCSGWVATLCRASRENLNHYTELGSNITGCLSLALLESATDVELNAGHQRTTPKSHDLLAVRIVITEVHQLVTTKLEVAQVKSFSLSELAPIRILYHPIGVMPESKFSVGR